MFVGFSRFWPIFVMVIAAVSVVNATQTVDAISRADAQEIEPASSSRPSQAGSAQAGNALTTSGMLAAGLRETPSQASAIESATTPPPSGAAWRKGGFKIIPYGAFWADMKYSTQRTSPGAFTFFVVSPEVQGEPSFDIDARRTRFGFDVLTDKGALFENAESGGRIEIDFFGDFITENKAGVLLRHAYWEVKNESYRFLVGQTWDVVSPRLPGTLDYAAGYLAGNIGFRRAQFRAERYFELDFETELTFQFSLNQDIVTDFSADIGIRREPSSWPVVQARTAIDWPSRGNRNKKQALGFSGHIGETGFDFLTTGPPPNLLPPEDDARFLTWSMNVDFYLPLANRWGLQGEFFHGANLSTFLGGIGQGICPCVRVPIRSTGGWAEFWYDWNQRWHSHLGYGLDDPRNADTQLGRSYNQFLFANLVLDVNQKLTTGIEVTYWKTLYQEQRVGLIPPELLTPSEPGNAVVINWMVKYSF